MTCFRLQVKEHRPLVQQQHTAQQMVAPIVSLQQGQHARHAAPRHGLRCSLSKQLFQSQNQRYHSKLIRLPWQLSVWKIPVLQGHVAQQQPVQGGVYRLACQHMQNLLLGAAALLEQILHQFRQPVLLCGFKTSTGAQTRILEPRALSQSYKNVKATTRNSFTPTHTTLSANTVFISPATTSAPGRIAMRIASSKGSKRVTFTMAKKLCTEFAAGLPSKSAARSEVQNQLKIKTSELEPTTAAHVWHHPAALRLCSIYSNPVQMSKRIAEQVGGLATMPQAVSTYQPGCTVVNSPGHTGKQENIFSFAWEGVQGTRPLSDAFLEKCSEGLEENFTQLLQQLQALIRTDKYCGTCEVKSAGIDAPDSGKLYSTIRHNLEGIKPSKRRTTVKKLFQDLACGCYIAEALHLSRPSLLRAMREATAMAAALSLHSAYRRWSERQRTPRQFEAFTEGFVLGRRVSFSSTHDSVSDEEVAAEESALLLRSLGSGGTTGTHTVSYISDLLSASFRQGSRRQETTASCDYGYSRSCIGTPTRIVNADGIKSKVELSNIGSPASLSCNPTSKNSMKKSVGAADETTCLRISPSLDGAPASIISNRQGIDKRWRRRRRSRLAKFLLKRMKKYKKPPYFDLRHPGDTVAALVQALMIWSRASMITASSLTNAIQGYALNACKQGLILVHWADVETFLKPIANNAALFSSQQSMEIFESLLFLDCRDECPTARTVVETLSNAFVRRTVETSSASTTTLPCPISYQQLVLWLVVLAKYRVENDDVYALAWDNMQHVDTLQKLFTPSLIAGCTYALTKFVGAGPLSLMIENMVVLARQQLHRFNLGDMSQLLVSLARRDAVDKVLLARCAARLKKDLALAVDGGDCQSQVDLALSDQQVVNLCVAFARQRFQDETLFNGLAHLLLAPYLRYSEPRILEKTVAGNMSQSCRLDYLGFGDLTSIVVAFARVRVLHSALFQEVDTQLLDRLQTASSSASTLYSCIQLLKAHSKLAYRTTKLQQCILLAVTRYLCGTNTQRAPAKELADFSKAADNLGLVLTLALRKRLESSLSRHIFFPNASQNEQLDRNKDDLYIEPPIGEWRRRTIECSSSHRKRKKARKRKWTW